MKSSSFYEDNNIIQSFLDENRQVILAKKKKLDPRAVDDGKLNYARLYIPSAAEKISVVGNYVTNEEAFRKEHRYVRLAYDEQENTLVTTSEGTGWDDFYYGVSPVIDSRLIIEEIRSRLLQGAEGIYRFVCKYATHFMIHEVQKDMLPAISQYIVAAMLQKFGVKFLHTPSLAERIEALSDKNIKTVEVKQGNKTQKQIHVFGCPSAAFFEAVRELKFQREGLLLVAAEEGLSFATLFEAPGVIHNLSGSVYYSGVLLRALRIEQESDAVNQGVVALRIHFERTTYATIDALSGNFTANCFLSCEARKKIVQILREDDKLRQELLVEREQVSSVQFLPCVNEYLSKTVSAVQVGVSANIISSDGFLLFGKRESNAIDGNHLYPGVNGNAEIADKNVAFYKTSTKEDYPDIDVNNLLRIDFNGEISREMLAELDIDSIHKNWSCYGICLSGTTPSYPADKENYRESERRLHFNILFEQKIETELYEIKKRQRNATEKYENKCMIGVKYSFFATVLSYLLQKASALIKSVLALKDLIATVAAVVVFFCGVAGNGAGICGVDIHDLFLHGFSAKRDQSVPELW